MFVISNYKADAQSAWMEAKQYQQGQQFVLIPLYNVYNLSNMFWEIISRNQFSAF